MTQSVPRGYRPRPFRGFVTQQYWENRREYEAWGQTQPHTLEQYWRENKWSLVEKYRLTVRETSCTIVE